MKTIPVIRGSIGSTEYFIATMKAAEVVSTLKIPKEMPDWDNETLEERFQREIDYKRVKEHIAPYLATDADRFFGALIVDVLNSEEMKFESLIDAGLKVPTFFQSIMGSVGVLYLQGSEVLVPLDGQHRLAALRFAMFGKDEKEQDIPHLKPNQEIGKDDITLIIVKHDDKKARKIFNKVNRYAKATSKTDNLITADDDIVAVITRDIANELFNSRLVNWTSNTLSATTGAFTTLSTIYEATTDYLEATISTGKIDKTKLPSLEVQQLWEQESRRLWKLLTTEISIIEDALMDPEESGDQKRIEIRESYLLGKPVAQLALVIAIGRAVASGVSVEKALGRANSIDWSKTNPLWQRVLINGEKVISGKQPVRFASRFIARLIGESLDEKETQHLLEQYQSQFDPIVAGTKALPNVIA
jgi:DNA sulfur modification protein DndB